MEAFPEMNNTGKLLYESLVIGVKGDLSIRMTKEEKNELLDKSISDKRTYLEKTNAIGLYNQLTEFSAETIDSLEDKGKAFQGISQMLGMFPSETHQALKPENLELIRKMSGDADADKIDIKQADLVINDFGTVIPTLKFASETDNPTETFLKFIIYIHYEIMSLKYLHELKSEINAPPSLGKELEKIKWQGTQKELAELFVELENKGWIKEKSVELIKAYFTKSDTIQQVYTPAYKPSFDQIKPIKTLVK
jgi:hypothetical protein